MNYISASIHPVPSSEHEELISVGPMTIIKQLTVLSQPGLNSKHSFLLLRRNISAYEEGWNKRSTYIIYVSVTEP